MTPPTQADVIAQAQKAVASAAAVKQAAKDTAAAIAAEKGTSATQPVEPGNPQPPA